MSILTSCLFYLQQCQVAQCIEVLTASLKNQKWAHIVTAIISATVPVIKLSVHLNGVLYRFDITFDTPIHTGLMTREYVNSLLKDIQPLRPLTLVMKQLLTQGDLSNSYSGGLCSYALVIMIASVLLRHNLVTNSSNLGKSLFLFLSAFVPAAFDPKTMAVCLRHPALFVPVTATDSSFQSDPIILEDPLNTSNNVGRNCYRIDRVLSKFGDSLAIITASNECMSRDAVTKHDQVTLLGVIFGTSHHLDVCIKTVPNICDESLPSPYTSTATSSLHGGEECMYPGSIHKSGWISPVSANKDQQYDPNPAWSSCGSSVVGSPNNSHSSSGTDTWVTPARGAPLGNGVDSEDKYRSCSSNDSKTIQTLCRENASSKTLGDRNFIGMKSSLDGCYAINNHPTATFNPLICGNVASEYTSSTMMPLCIGFRTLGVDNHRNIPVLPTKRPHYRQVHSVPEVASIEEPHWSQHVTSLLS